MKITILKVTMNELDNDFDRVYSKMTNILQQDKVLISRMVDEVLAEDNKDHSHLKNISEDVHYLTLEQGLFIKAVKKFKEYGIDLKVEYLASYIPLEYTDSNSVCFVGKFNAVQSKVENITTYGKFKFDIFFRSIKYLVTPIFNVKLCNIDVVDCNDTWQGAIIRFEGSIGRLISIISSIEELGVEFIERLNRINDHEVEQYVIIDHLELLLKHLEDSDAKINFSLLSECTVIDFTSKDNDVHDGFYSASTNSVIEIPKEVYSASITEVLERLAKFFPISIAQFSPFPTYNTLGVK